VDESHDHSHAIPSTGEKTKAKTQKYGRTIAQLDSTTGMVNAFGVSDILAIQPNLLYTVGLGVFKYNNGTWERVFDNGSVISGIAASSPNNIFAFGRGIVLNYNGKDWYRYTQFMDQNVVYYRAWTRRRGFSLRDIH